jgi:hypothetical protein
VSGARRSPRDRLYSQDEIHDIGAIADFLGDKPFLMGETRTEIDAVAYGSSVLRVT